MNNTIIGYEAGMGTSLHNKSGNVFLGYQAGYYEIGDNKLYIENSDTTEPLIYGEFDNDLLRVNGTFDINNAYYFPLTDGTSGQVLQTDGSGVLSWSNSSGGATQIDDLTDGKTDGYSVFLGSGAGINDDGTNNGCVAVGIEALTTNTTGNGNIAIGYKALLSNSTGSHNTASGYRVLENNTIGSGNTAIGEYSLHFNLTGNSNTGVGMYSLYMNSTGLRNTAFGYSSLNVNSSGNENTSVGEGALGANTTGDNNTAIGRGANRYNQQGSNNTMIGYQAGRGSPYHNKSGNVFIGYQAGYNETGNNRLYIENSNSASPLIYGEFDNDLLRVNGTFDINNAYQFPNVDGSSGQVLQTDGNGLLTWTNSSGGGASEIDDLTDAKTSTRCVFLGLGAGIVDDGTLNNNVGVGIETLNLNTSGENNTAIGYNSLKSNTTGVSNSAVGSLALNSNTIGSRNTVFGVMASTLSTDGDNNTIIGTEALFYNSSGSDNTAIGDAASVWNSTGSSNVAIGRQANFYNESGSNNTIIGFQAGYGPSSSNISGNIFIGYKSGYNESGSNKLYIENSDASTPLIYGEFDNDLLKINGNLVTTGTTTINDILHLTPLASAPSSASNGDIYIGTDNHIYCYLGGAWKQLDN